MQISGQGSAGASSAAMIQQMRDRMFARADKDGDGGLSLDEFKAIGRQKRAGAAGEASGPASTAAAAAFKALDADGDGKLTTAELGKGRHQDGTARIATDGLSALLGAQEAAGGQAQAGSTGIQAVMSRMLQAYGGSRSAFAGAATA